jgi:two-component system, NtrC family, sensor kinase
VVSLLRKEVVRIDDNDDERSFPIPCARPLDGKMHGFMSERFGHCLNIPLECRGKVLGCNELYRVDFEEISDEQQALLRSIGKQIGIALESLSGLQKLIQAKELLQSVFDGITDLVILLDKDYRIKMVNKGYLNNTRSKRKRLSVNLVIWFMPA